MFVCLVLYSLCRDVFVPVIIVLTMPFNLVKDFLFTGYFKLRGGVCVRANLVVLVKLLSGATVLLARCTSTHHQRKVDVTRTTMTTTKIHLHPVLVATLAVVVKLFPLVITAKTKTGKGHSLKINAMKNVLINAITLLFMIPILFAIFRTVRRHIVPHHRASTTRWSLLKRFCVGWEGVQCKRGCGSFDDYHIRNRCTSQV